MTQTPPENLDALIEEFADVAERHRRRANVLFALAMLLSFAAGLIVGTAF